MSCFRVRLIPPSTLLLLLLLLCLVAFAVTGAAQQLPDDEEQALRVIAKVLNKMSWDFTVNPCSNEPPWVTSDDDSVECDCFMSNGTVCHVTSISLKSQSLQGTLPPDFVKLPYIQNIDLSRNYLSGSLPPQWGALQNIVNISLLGNRLTGPIPKEFGNMSTLLSLVVEMNHLSGELPQELGKLRQIQRLLLTSNNFTGELPFTFANLSTLQDVRLGDNHFTGKIPDFIRSWTNLTKLVIQASGLQGPIPSSIRVLERLTDLRITDLNGTEALFPNLTTSVIETLILRNCNLVGELPRYLRELASLKVLDVSFNKIGGVIPDSYRNLDLDELYLTGNLLTGPVPNWIKKGDLSFNNFTGIPACQPRTELNLFTSTSVTNNSGVASCLKVSHCPKRGRYNLYINCGGGQEVTIGSRTYMVDNDPGSRARFFENHDSYWGYSSTGEFMDDGSSDSLIASNQSKLSIENPQLYMNSRLAPTSLTYYAYCLMTGNYTVHLHFAEIIFTGDESYRSLGRRVFNVFIQGKMALQDFNIEDAVGGAGKATEQNFTASVTNGTLEIRFYWAGKGTNAIPDRGVYGPLISAITVDPLDFEPPEDSKISAGVVVGIVVSIAFVVILIVGILWWRGCFRRRDTTEQDLKGLDLQTGSFTLRQIKAATSNFSPDNKIGEGGFGSVYKGLLADGTIIAVKQLSAKSKQGNREFVNEIGMISGLQHPHLVKLYGCCIEGNQLLLVYEYMENNSLARALLGPKECQLHLDWKTRQKICVGIARGLAYLHEESRLKIVHRDIKATNVLLDKHLNPKISDFGLAKLDEEDNTHISTRIAGTFGYMAPEYAMRGYLTDKADVYSFGIVALEIVSGQCNTSYRGKQESFYLLDWAHVLRERGDLMELIDPRLGADFNKDEVMAMIHVALLCTHVSPAIRPSMSAVVSMLEGKANVPASIPENTVADDDKKYKAMRKHFRGIVEEEEERDESKKQVHHHSMSIDAPWTGSSTSTNDLYPMLLDSDYWRNRE
ncbi:probable leucine-rich repeat receptor-like serine/threonine-protein kinase At3g14840 isoform X1 [Punica granatum]|uniref:non-specific serine/threonine protein kinase n=2 Tax=Punica granatum TaxID=22663 RepID=A0A6P8E2H4_PUNGR|nr:probable leucine-rich repeat receptor-like serine/threonine-protein kinase At3g14840 isoform X1 [Punica granatum]